MKKLLLLLCLVAATSVRCQVKKDKNGNYYATKDSAKVDVPFNKTYTDGKGVVYPLFVTDKGKLYYYRVSKTGKRYKSYLKLTN